MVKYQKVITEIKDFVFDKEGNAHTIDNGVLTGEIIPKNTLDQEWAPAPLAQ